MIAPTWSFPPHLEGYVAQNPIQRGFFTVDSIGGLDQALVREAIQNALDARSGEEPVGVRFSITRVDPERYIPYFEGLYPHLNATVDEVMTIPDFTEELPFLIIEDFNTTGLEGDPEQGYIENPAPKQNFYYFWRNVGRTGKGEGTRGRWGLGKTVFPATSTFSTFFGLTRRLSDGKTLLMGQSVLKYHTVNKQIYTPYGYFGLFRADHLAVPISNEAIIADFCKTFSLLRNEFSGFSIVIPAPGAEIELNRISIGVISQYFYAILQRDLQVQIDVESEIFRITARTIETHVEKMPEKVEGSSTFDKHTLVKSLQFARWSIGLDDSEYIVLNPPDLKRSPDWKAYLTAEQITQAKAQFEATGRVAFRVGMKVKRGKQAQSGWFKVFLERDESLGRAESHFLRNGIRLVDVKGHSLRGVRGLVVIDAQPLNEMLGDAENPAHTEWQKDTPAFKKYEHGPSSLSFVKNSLSFLAGKLTEVGTKVEKDLLKDIFFIEQRLEPAIPEGSDNGTQSHKPDRGRSDPTFPILPSKTPVIESRKIPGGLEFWASNTETNVGEVTVQFAYEVRAGNPFQKYSPFDFDLANQDMQIESDGLKIIEYRENILRFEVLDEGFIAQVTGFDGLRDIVVSVKWTERSE
jgi:hypothetical protein